MSFESKCHSQSTENPVPTDSWKKLEESGEAMTPESLSEAGFEGYGRFFRSGISPHLWMSPDFSLPVIDEKGLVVFLNGPSGVGKDSIIDGVEAVCPGLVCRVVTATDRVIRENETDGEDYYYVSEGEFDEMIQTEQFTEWASINNGEHRSGVPSMSLEKARRCAEIPLFRINIIGIKKVRPIIEKDFSAVSVAVLPEMSLDSYNKMLYLRRKDAQIRHPKALEEIKMSGIPDSHTDFIIGNPPDPSGRPYEAIAAFHTLLHTLLGKTHEDMR